MPALKFVKMVELDVGKKESAWIEGAALRWARKLGRVVLGSLNKDMYEAHSIATRKRSVPSLEESIKSIQLEENNDIKLTAKVLKLFFFFWDKNANLATEAVIAETVGPKEASQAPTAPVSEIPARITEAPVSEHLKFSEIPARITEEKYFFLSQWPAQIKKSVQQIEDLAAALFPYEGDIRYVLLFVALKLHPLGPLGNFLKEVVDAIDFLKKVHSSKHRSSSKTNLCTYLINGSVIPSSGQFSPMDATEIYNSLLKNNGDRFVIARALAIKVICDGAEPFGIKSGRCALALLAHSCMSDVRETLEQELGYFGDLNHVIEVDAEHALAAQSIFGESGHKFTKMKRACRVAVDNCIKWPADKEVRGLKKTKHIGELPQEIGSGGRYNTIDAVQERYLLSQAFVAKCHDIYFQDADDNDKVKVLAIFTNDGAEMAADRNQIIANEMFIPAAYGDPNDIHFIQTKQDPALLINLGMVEGKENLLSIQSLSSNIFQRYDAKRKYNISKEIEAGEKKVLCAL